MFPCPRVKQFPEIFPAGENFNNLLPLPKGSVSGAYSPSTIVLDRVFREVILDLDRRSVMPFEPIPDDLATFPSLRPGSLQNCQRWSPTRQSKTRLPSMTHSLASLISMPTGARRTSLSVTVDTHREMIEVDSSLMSKNRLPRISQSWRRIEGDPAPVAVPDKAVHEGKARGPRTDRPLVIGIAPLHQHAAELHMCRKGGSPPLTCHLSMTRFSIRCRNPSDRISTKFGASGSRIIVSVGTGNFSTSSSTRF